MSDDKKPADRLTTRGLPPITDETHNRAVEAMKPYIKDFQKAADQQTAADFGTDTLKSLLRESRRGHDVICPKHDEADGVCNCGADLWNERVDAVLGKP